MSEDRDAKLREIARELHGDPCPHPEQPEQGMNECLDCILSALSAARAEGERAGRGAEREAWAAWCEAEAAGCRALDLPYCERALLSKAAEVRARGSE